MWSKGSIPFVWAVPSAAEARTPRKVRTDNGNRISERIGSPPLGFEVFRDAATGGLSRERAFSAVDIAVAVDSDTLSGSAGGLIGLVRRDKRQHFVFGCLPMRNPVFQPGCRVALDSESVALGFVALAIKETLVR